MSNKDIARRTIEEVWNKGNFVVLNESYAREYVHHDPNAPEVRDLAGFKKWAAAVRLAFPDFHVKAEEMLEEGGTVVTRWTATGTHKGAFLEVPATGKKLTNTGVSIHHVRNGKIVEGWWAYDAVGMMRQLGVIPPAVAA